MPDTAELLAQPEIIKHVGDLIIYACSHAGIGYVTADKVRIAAVSRMEQGEKVEPLVSLAVALRAAALEEAAKIVDGAREWAEGDLRGPRDTLRAMAKDPNYQRDVVDEEG